MSSQPETLQPMGLRARVAVSLGRFVAEASRLARLGSGSVIGGRVSLAVDPRLLTKLTAGRRVALVSATNGKTTTTRLLSAAMATSGPVVSNVEGANMAPGHVAALGRARADATAVLEVDERWLGKVAAQTHPQVIALLNLSRDQLDRSHEVRKLAARWREALTSDPPSVVVANCDDPLVAWAALPAPSVRWVSAGSAWTADSTGCPSCEGRLAFEEERGGSRGGWRCTACDLRRPEPDVWLEGDDVVDRDGSRWTLDLLLPGRVNRANAAVALTAATALGAEPASAAEAMGEVREVAGRYSTVTVGGSKVRLLLAKNPAGWQEALDMLAPPPHPVIVAINARVADGHDPSWLWDVPFEQLAGRSVVVATGERRSDLAVRLRYAGVDHVVEATLEGAVRAAGTSEVDLAANYTAFQSYLAEVSP